MGKTAPAKQKGGQKGGDSVRSRAARRATSPGIDTDKSLKNVELPAEPTTRRPTVLAVHQGAGITKKSKNGRKSQLSAKAKKRQEKGMDRAEAVMDKKENKIEKSKGRARTVQERAKNWEELNKRMLEKKEKDEAERLKKEEDDENEEWVDEEVEMVVDENVEPQAVPLPLPTDEEVEIL